MVTEKKWIEIVISEQKLYLYKSKESVKCYRISSSKFGIGNKMGSNKTPLGLHRIIKKTGNNAKQNEIFINGKKTGKLASVNKWNFNADLITTRIIYLEGMEEGMNKGKGIDSRKRSILIHGTADEKSIGKPASHGCIRMKNCEIIELFDLIEMGVLVKIIE